MDTGNAALMLMASCFVFIMAMGIAFYYGGLVRAKSVLNMVTLTLGSVAVTAVTWLLWGWSLAFGSDVGGFMGNPTTGFLFKDTIIAKNGQFVSIEVKNALYEHSLDVAFQLAIAIVAVVFISGALAERVKAGTWMLFTLLWVTFVYAPLVHMERGQNGWLSSTGAFAQAIGTSTIDCASGALVGVASAVSALMIVVIIGKRKRAALRPIKPHNLPLSLIGGALILLGGFGLTCGSTLAAGGSTGYAWLATIISMSGACLAWMMVERLRTGRFTALGAISGMISGLIAILPGVDAVAPLWALVIGLVAGVCACFATGMKYSFGYDDSLDVVAINGVSGVVGMLLTGLFARDMGLFAGGDWRSFVLQLITVAFVILYAGVMTGLIAFILEKTMGWRVSETAEVVGIDIVDQGENAYDFEDTLHSTITKAK